MIFRKSVSPDSAVADPVTLDLVLAQDGDARAFDRFVRATEADVRRFCQWLCQPGPDLDDLVQETYVRAFRGVTSFRAASSARSWLLTIARRVCADHVGRRVRDRRNVTVVPVAPDRIECSSGFFDLADEVQRVPVAYRDAFVLVAVMGFSYDEAGRILDCPRGTVQSRVARARLHLATRLSDEADAV